MNSMEKVIKEKTDEIVEKYRKAYVDNGMNFDSVLETILRQGIAYGVSFSAMSLASMPQDIVIGE